jgi:hypothetical protein
VLINAAVGGFAAYKVRPFQNATAEYYPLFRKSFMKYNIQLAVFCGLFYTASMFQTRFFPRLSMKFFRQGYGGDGGSEVERSGHGINGNIYLHNQDLISKFRIFDNNPTAMADTKQQVSSYLDMYETGPLTKASMLQRLNDGQGIDPDFANKF